MYPYLNIQLSGRFKMKPTFSNFRKGKNKNGIASSGPPHFILLTHARRIMDPTGCCFSKWILCCRFHESAPAVPEKGKPRREMWLLAMCIAGKERLKVIIIKCRAAVAGP